MTLTQYRLLKELHKLGLDMDSDQKFPLHSISSIKAKTKLSTEEVLSTIKELGQLSYVEYSQLNENAGTRSGYIHVARITYCGVVAKNKYIGEKIWRIISHIIVPAVVSILCSLIVHFIVQQ